jgi:hypothetical protein
MLSTAERLERAQKLMSGGSFQIMKASQSPEVESRRLPCKRRGMMELSGTDKDRTITACTPASYVTYS